MNYGSCALHRWANFERAGIPPRLRAGGIIVGVPTALDYASTLLIDKFGAFGQLEPHHGKLSTILCLRTDWTCLGGATVTRRTRSRPRLSLSYAVSDAVNYTRKQGALSGEHPTLLGYREQVALENCPMGGLASRSRGGGGEGTSPR
jgi:hypothetical protein